jgi:hypothetical protein
MLCVHSKKDYIKGIATNNLHFTSFTDLLNSRNKCIGKRIPDFRF